MAHNVKCYYCGKTFNRDKEPFVQVGSRRYAHKLCAEKAETHIEEVLDDKGKLEQYIMKLFGEEYVNPTVRKQINEYVDTYNFTYSGILKALTYFYEIKGNNVDKANNRISIVPYIYKDAFNYYYNLWLAQQKNKDFKIEEYHPEEIVIKIPRPQRSIKKRQLFTFLDEGEEQEE